MPRCIIILPLYAGEAPDEVRKETGDLLLCADGGYERATACGLIPDGVIGDFDSMPRERVGDCPVLMLPTHKDDTDTARCMEEGRRRGYRSFVLAGGVGGRLDHTLSNLQLLYDAALRGEEAVLLGGYNQARVLLPGSYDLPCRPGWKLSLLAYSPQVEGVCLQGVEYPLQDAELTSRYPLGVSNEWTAPRAELSFTAGALTLLYAKDAPLRQF